MSIVYSLPIVMSRHKKTRQQKVIADLRRKLTTIDTPSSETLKQKLSVKPAFSYTTPPSSALSSSSLPYLKQEIRTILILTALLIITEIILYILLTKQILTIPMVSY